MSRDVTALQEGRREQFLRKLADIKASKAKQWISFEKYKSSVLKLAVEHWNDLTETEQQLFKDFECEEPRRQ